MSQHSEAVCYVAISDQNGVEATDKHKVTQNWGLSAHYLENGSPIFGDLISLPVEARNEKPHG